MKTTKLLWVLALVFVIGLAACMVSTPNELVGSWQKENGSTKIEFSRDGKLNFTGGPAAISTSFKLEEKDKLVADLGIFGTAAIKYAVSKDTLTLTDAQGVASKYTRVKEVKANEKAGEAAHPAKP